ncbi:secreted protein [Streptomyces lincolnensis]|uniref:Secreted protein n=1 Tax=Streptomyces lincolnensis TaxID=1915 RepID=A0A1B1M1W4_STRLN|nr:secreted protein [Streptomyces lincolnensis]
MHVLSSGMDTSRRVLIVAYGKAQNSDSANHRTHVDFVEADGTCSNGFQAIPQLQARLVYDVPAPRIQNGQVVNPFAVDSFPDQLHKPITDHNDFLNFFDESTMKQMVECINNGQDCQ